MTENIGSRLERAVRVLCPDIYANVFGTESKQLSEKALWRELFCCVLSSQVRYELAQCVSKRLVDTIRPWVCSDLSALESKTVEALLAPNILDGRSVRYRFPYAKGRQIARGIVNISRTSATLSTITYKFKSADDTRGELIRLFPGLGYKQASMYLRNVGRTFDLAILDRHVFTYIDLVGIADRVGAISAKRYVELERRLSVYAHGLGYSVGCVDWAIWIVMRTARKEGYL